MSTPDLFAPQPRARNTDPSTSHAAAASMLGDPCRCQRAAILGVLWRPMTAGEIGRLTGLSMEQVCRRLPELEQGGHARPTGQERPGPSGRLCRVWERA
jgi:hypothetical protein